MLRQQGEPAADGPLKNVRVYVKCAGGLHSRYVLLIEYAPSARGAKKRIQSNHPRYGKSWASKEDICDSDKADFVHWVNHSLARGGGGKRRAHAEVVRSSSRVDKSSMQKPVRVLMSGDGTDFEVEHGVLQCVQGLIHNVIHQTRHGGDGLQMQRRINYVEGKRRRKTEVATLPQPFWAGRLTKRMKRARLTHRRAKGYAYRVAALQRASAKKTEEDLDWLQIHEPRLATIVARQCLHELLPEGASLSAHRVHDSPEEPISHVLIAPLSGDYSDAQLLRVHRQAMVLRRYYELLLEAIRNHQDGGHHFYVVAVATRAGKTLGEESVASSTVRSWHVDYVKNEGRFSPDERGHYTRELLIMEEDIKCKFVKWSLLKAKKDELSLEAARDFLNEQLLVELDVCIPQWPLYVAGLS